MRDALMAELAAMYDKLNELDKLLKRLYQEPMSNHVDSADNVIGQLENQYDDLLVRARNLAARLIALDMKIMGRF